MRYLGIDLGSKTVGLAMSDTTLTIASTYKTIFFKDEDYNSTINEIKDITVVDALKTVERQSKMSINYSDSELKGKKIADLNLENVSVTTALDAILKGTGFSYQIQGNYINLVEMFWTVIREIPVKDWAEVNRQLRNLSKISKGK
jgi:hypothetical protein